MSPQQFAQLFRQERSTFARTYPRAARATLWLSDRYSSPTSPGRERDAAWCVPRSARVYFCHRVLRSWPVERLVAVIDHELGHLVDRSRAPGCEVRADRLAERATGRRLRYDDEGIQTLGPGTPRPAWLHQ